MSLNDNKCLTYDVNKQSIDLSDNQMPDFDQHLTKGLSFTQFFSQLVTNVAIDSDKWNVWSDVLLDIIDNNAINETMLSDVMNITIIKSKSDSIPNRVFSCKMVSKLSQRFNETIFMSRMYPLVQYLCQDVEPTVRALMSTQLLLLSQNFSLQTIQTQILPQLIELIKDKEPMVRIGCFDSLIHSMTKLSDDLNEQIVLPLIVRVFDNALYSNDCSLDVIFSHFGNLCQILPKDVMANEKWFLNYYCNVFLISNDFQFFAKNQNYKERDVNCRKLLALYFPVLLTIYGQNDTLLSLLNYLCSDLDPSVAQSMASVFNDISKQLNNSFKLYPQLSKLLSTKNVNVIKELMPFLSQLLFDAIKSTPDENKSTLFDDLSNKLIATENTICLRLDWRLQIKFFECLTLVMPFLPTDAITNQFIPLLLNRIVTTRPIPVRMASSVCVIALFRDIPSLLKDLNIYEWFVKTLFVGNSSQRMLFLNVCELIDQLCDKDIMISYFLEPLLHLREDKVPNIRLNVCKKIKSFKPLLQMPELSDRVEAIKDMFRQMLAIEEDRDVIDSIKQMVDEMDWKSDSNQLDFEELTQKFYGLTIDGIDGTASGEVVVEVNNNSFAAKEDIICDKSDSTKHKSCLPQLIRSQWNCSSNRNHINGLHSMSSMSSKIPKVIKCSKNN